jgi:hypothetical protein
VDRLNRQRRTATLTAVVTILIADTQRLTAMRDGLDLPGRVLRFSNSNLASAFESIRAHQPGIVAIDALFAQTPEGRAFVDRVGQLAIPQSEIHLVALVNGAWTMTSVEATPDQAEAPMAGLVPLNTRRTPRFMVLKAIDALVEGRPTHLVDLSVLGAQVISVPVLRPNQRIKITLPDTDEALQLTAHVAWSIFEKPRRSQDPHFRAGMEFSDAAARALEDYCRRYCSGDPLSERSG